MPRSVYEKKAIKELKENGWEVDFKIRPSRPTKGYNTDYFGRWDIVAYKEGCPIRWIAVKGHMGIPKKLKEITENFKPIGHQMEIWYFPKGKRRFIKKTISFSK